jgi:RNA polymerase sigma-70 factor (ECF subfamily)
LDDARAKAAESLFQTHCVSAEPAGEDRVFERTWAEALVRVGLERLAAEQKAEGKHKLFEELRIFLTSSPNPLPTYDDLAVRLSLPPSTLRSHVTRLRARYRELLRAEVRRTVDTEAEVDGELHWLFRVLAGE